MQLARDFLTCIAKAYQVKKTIKAKYHKRKKQQTLLFKNLIGLAILINISVVLKQPLRHIVKKSTCSKGGIFLEEMSVCSMLLKMNVKMIHLENWYLICSTNSWEISICLANKIVSVDLSGCFWYLGKIKQNKQVNF